MPDESTTCLSCRQCCIKFGVVIPNEKDPVEFFTAWGFKVSSLGPDEVGVVIDHPCQHLKENGCDIYDTRPQYCRQYKGDDPAVGSFCQIHNTKEAE